MDNGNYKCRICDKRYVSLLNKPYRKHLEMYHKDLMVEDVAFDFNLKINDLAGDKNNRFISFIVIKLILIVAQKHSKRI